MLIAPHILADSEGIMKLLIPVVIAIFWAIGALLSWIEKQKKQELERRRRMQEQGIDWGSDHIPTGQQVPAPPPDPEQVALQQRRVEEMRREQQEIQARRERMLEMDRDTQRMESQPMSSREPMPMPAPVPVRPPPMPQQRQLKKPKAAKQARQARQAPPVNREAPVRISSAGQRTESTPDAATAYDMPIALGAPGSYAASVAIAPAKSNSTSNETARNVRLMLSPAGVREAFIVGQVLGKPKSME
jgi:hypothetical protein